MARYKDFLYIKGIQDDKTMCHFMKNTAFLLWKMVLKSRFVISVMKNKKGKRIKTKKHKE